MQKMLCLFVGLLFSVVTHASNPYFDKMVVFGDSLSDNGNLYRYVFHLLPISPPYFEGHFSNGPLWIEQLFSSYYPDNNQSNFLNYAVGGAGAVLSYNEILPYTLTVELDNYFYWHTSDKIESSLFSIWIGANNYLNGPTNIEEITNSVVDAIAASVARLIERGGDKFLVINLPDLGRTPQIADPEFAAHLTRLTIAHNQKLALKITQLREAYPQVTIVYFDAYNFFEQAMQHASDYGFTNIADPCYMGSYTGWIQALNPDDERLYANLKERSLTLTDEQWQMIKGNPQLREAATAGYIYDLLPQKNKDEALQCDGYLFWDHVHPTTAAHRLLAEQVKIQLDDAGLQTIESAHYFYKGRIDGRTNK